MARFIYNLVCSQLRAFGYVFSYARTSGNIDDARAYPHEQVCPMPESVTILRNKQGDIDMNWLTILQSIFKLIPYVVQGIEVVHAGESTETKLQLAQDALKVATGAASAILAPGNAEIATAVSGAVTVGIQSAQTLITATQTPAQTTANKAASNAPLAVHSTPLTVNTYPLPVNANPHTVVI